MKLDDLVLHPSTKAFLTSYTKHPKQGLLLTGLVGSGLYTTAHALAESISTHPSNIMVVLPDEKGTISIERVRALYVETRSIRSEHFVIVIDNVESMSHDAQNAFLKLLEEPIDNIYFLLTAHEPSQLLPTILSRVQVLELAKVSATASESLLRAHHVSTATALQQMLFIASGLPAELVRLASDKEYFEQKAQSVRLARDFLTADIHERLTLVSQINGREEALSFVATIATVLKFTAERDSKSAMLKQSEAIETVTSRLLGNGHVRSQLMFLAVNVV